MTPTDRILIAKAAADTGWDIPTEPEGEWLRCASARFESRAWVSHDPTGPYRLAVSSRRLFRELARELPTDATPSPGIGCILSADIAALDSLLTRAARLALALPDLPVRQFREALSRHRPDHTEVERLTRQRIGQDLFRAALLDYWGGACAVTGLAVPELLRASHIRPWAQCESDEQRLDVFNGLLLAPHLDALFDGGWIGFEADGSLRISPRLDGRARGLLGLDSEGLRLRWVEAEHGVYLAYHRTVVWQR